MWDPRGQLPGTGIRRDGENLHGYGDSPQGVSGTSSGSVAVAGESSSGGHSLQGNDKSDDLSTVYPNLSRVVEVHFFNSKD